MEIFAREYPTSVEIYLFQPVILSYLKKVQ